MSPSGITADIYDGKDVSLRNYLMRVGRGMGYAILQRDDDPDAPVEIAEASTYYERRVPELEARLRQLRRMTGREAARAARADYEAQHRAWRTAKATRAALRARYEDMLARVEEWQPDPLVTSTKDYAIKYLRESIEFDCGRDGDDMKYYPEPQPKMGGQWVRDEMDEAERSLERALDELQKERERTADRNRYIDAFLRSLPTDTGRIPVASGADRP